MFTSISSGKPETMLFGSSFVDKNSVTPYSDATRTKKHKPNYVKRPMNPFMVWSRIERRKISNSLEYVNNTNISRHLGKVWRALSDEERRPYIEEAERLRQLHLLEYPDYKYQPKKKRKSKMQIGEIVYIPEHLKVASRRSVPDTEGCARIREFNAARPPSQLRNIPRREYERKDNKKISVWVKLITVKQEPEPQIKIEPAVNDFETANALPTVRNMESPFWCAEPVRIKVEGESTSAVDCEVASSSIKTEETCVAIQQECRDVSTPPDDATLHDKPQMPLLVKEEDVEVDTKPNIIIEESDRGSKTDKQRWSSKTPSNIPNSQNSSQPVNDTKPTFLLNSEDIKVEPTFDEDLAISDCREGNVPGLSAKVSSVPSFEASASEKACGNINAKTDGGSYRNNPQLFSFPVRLKTSSAPTELAGLERRDLGLHFLTKKQQLMEVGNPPVATSPFGLLGPRAVSKKKISIIGQPESTESTGKNTERKIVIKGPTVHPLAGVQAMPNKNTLPGCQVRLKRKTIVLTPSKTRVLIRSPTMNSPKSNQLRFRSMSSIGKVSVVQSEDYHRAPRDKLNSVAVETIDLCDEVSVDEEETDPLAFGPEDSFSISTEGGALFAEGLGERIQESLFQEAELMKSSATSLTQRFNSTNILCGESMPQLLTGKSSNTSYEVPDSTCDWDNESEPSTSSQGSQIRISSSDEQEDDVRPVQMIRMLHPKTKSRISVRIEHLKKAENTSNIRSMCPSVGDEPFENLGLRTFPLQQKVPIVLKPTSSVASEIPVNNFIASKWGKRSVADSPKIANRTKILVRKAQLNPASTLRHTGQSWIPTGNKNAWTLPNATLSDDDVSGDDDDVDYVKTITDEDRIVDRIELNDSDEEEDTVQLQTEELS